MPEAVAFAKRWVTECLRAAYPLGHGHGPVSALFRLQPRELRRHRGRRPRTRGRRRPASSLLTHGAGGNRESPMLIRLCDEWARRGWLAVRYDLPVPAASAEGSAVGIGGRRSGGHRRGGRAGPLADRRARCSPAATPTAAG